MEEEIIDTIVGGFMFLFLIGLVVAVIVLAVALANKNKACESAPDKSALLEQLKQLHDLYKQKAISQREYESLKSELLDS